MATFRLKSLYAQNNIMIKLCAEDNALEAEYARKKARGLDESHPDMQAHRAKIAEATKKSYDAFATFKKIYDQDKPEFLGLRLNEVEKYRVAKVKFILGQIQVLPVSGGVAAEGELRELHRQLREDLKQERQLLVELLLRSAEACKIYFDLLCGNLDWANELLIDEESQKNASPSRKGVAPKHSRSRSESVRRRDEPIGNIESMMGELEEDLMGYLRSW